MQQSSTWGVAEGGGTLTGWRRATGSGSRTGSLQQYTGRKGSVAQYCLPFMTQSFRGEGGANCRQGFTKDFQ